MGYRVGVDIGGTFIDFCFFDDATNDLFTLKVLTTPARPGSEIMEGIRLAEERHGVVPEQIASFVHGTTVGVNTVIQERGAKMALLTTENFEDVLALARLRMPETYSLLSHRADPLISRDLIFPISERMNSHGEATKALDEQTVRDAIKSAKEKGAEGFIVSFINAYRNPVHERRVREIVEEVEPEMFVFSASEVWPIIREYERTTTAVINGYVHPRVSGYISSLQKALKDRNVKTEPLITKSNGGVMMAELGKRSCVSMLLSGTASGVIGGAFVAEQAGVKNVLTLDIGGTSADVAVIVDGQPQFSSNERVGPHTIYIPAVAVSSIGDGGGSIAWVDEFGVLRVGPDSAGSDPGPACYGNGGALPTITDAFAVCGLIGQSSLAYGSISIDRDLASKAVGELASKLGKELEETAQMIIDVAISGMYLEINKLIARHGIDIRDFTLMAFGGAGPMLSPMLARELGIPKVLVPTTPGVVSALGSLVADIRNDFISSLYMPLEAESMPKITSTFDNLQTKAEKWLRQDQHYDGGYELTYSADMNYLGQSFEIEAVFDAEDISAGNFEKMREAFHHRHEQLYNYSDEDAEIHIVNLRMVISAKSDRPVLKGWDAEPGEAQPEKEVKVFLSGQWRNAGLYDREKLKAGQTFAGPAIVSQSDSTTCIPEGFDALVDPKGNIILTTVGE